MAYGDASDEIRKEAWESIIVPQIKKGSRDIEVPIKPLMKKMESHGFPPNHPRQFCKALQKRSFLQEKGLVLERIDGPPSGTSTTVVLHFQFANKEISISPIAIGETPAEKAFRLTEKIRGLLKDELAEYGGADGFMRWLRPDEEDAA